MFPRLHATIKPKRLETCKNATPSEDFLSSSPDPVFLIVASQLPISDLYTIAALSKHLRHRCLTTISYHNIVRERLFKTWATPLPSEYPVNIPEGYAHPSATGDWLLYGQHVYKTHSMRNRRRILNIIDQLKQKYNQKGMEDGYLAGPHAEQKQRYLRAIIDQQLLFRKLNEMYDFNMLINALTVLNKAYAEDLKG